MPNEFDPTRRRLLAASALAVTGLVFDDDAAAQQLPATACPHDSISWSMCGSSDL